jgi:hypothetical protein
VPKPLTVAFRVVRQALGLFAEAAADFEAVCTAAARDVQDRSLGSTARSAMSACTRSVRLDVRPNPLLARAQAAHPNRRGVARGARRHATLAGPNPPHVLVDVD